jgi:hypothetical protein
MSTLMGGGKWKRMVALLFCIALPALFSYGVRVGFKGPVKMPDFSLLYYATRCALQHKDPYNENTFLAEEARENKGFEHAILAGQKNTGAAEYLEYPPTTLMFAIPFAMLPWGTAQNLYVVAMAGLLALAGFLMWDLAGEAGPGISGLLAGFMMISCFLLFLLGNAAGITVSFGLIAAWCFLKDRYVWWGVALLAVSLALKPHDVGLIWLFFLLSGGMLRRRALQTLALAGALGVAAVLWMGSFAPQWPRELQQNMALLGARGNISDPGPTCLDRRSSGPVIDLQADLSIFRNDPRFYDTAAYLVIGGMIFAWGAAAVRKRKTQEGALLALAAIAILTLLPVYHRTHDAKLLLLTIPGCALLWAAGGAKRWAAVVFTCAAFLVTSDFAVVLLAETFRSLPAAPGTAGEKLIWLLHRPQPLVLLAAGCFYLWAFLRYEPVCDVSGEFREARGAAVQTVTPQVLEERPEDVGIARI